MRSSIMKVKKLRHTLVALVLALTMMVSGGALGMAFDSAFPAGTTESTIVSMLSTDSVYAAASSSRAKTIATKDAKSRYKIKRAYKVKAVSQVYRNNDIWKVTFYGKKSGTRYDYIYYVSKATKRILYRKQYFR